MVVSAAILAITVSIGALLLWPRVSRAPLWRAAMTPLASIIGSGFLILGPLLHANFGGFAPAAMLILCVLAWSYGAAIRFNIASLAGPCKRGPVTEGAENLASVSLAFAYIVSVAYYLNLFGAFGVSLTPVNDGHHARLLTTAMFAIILTVGWTRGFAALERLEQVSVGAKLAIIGGLLAGLALYFGGRFSADALVFPPAQTTGWPGLMLLAGLLVTVQGFETSRYLGHTYDHALRIRSMRVAQLIASFVYLIYIALLSYAFERGEVALEETAIIDLMEVVAPVLPVLLVVAALSAQLSAAVADTSGAGGLFSEVSRQRLKPRQAYGALVATGLLLTWTLDVFEIVTYASRAFALYYALQSGIAALTAGQTNRPVLAGLFAILSLTGVGIALFGAPSE